MAYSKKKKTDSYVKKTAFGKFQDKKGNNYLKGWKAGAHGFITIVAFAKDGDVHKTSTGKDYMNFVVTVVNKNAMTKSTVSGFWYPNEGKLRLPDFDIVCTLKGSDRTSNGKLATGSIVYVDKD